ncbi:MAG: hypothetical protein JW855_02335 [Gammaproteobacteria bacterium]|nr:hypothetical protein [Gammaproteobacteria bacterium]
MLLDSEGFTDAIRQAFLIYLASSPRPMSELLEPNLFDIEDLFHKEFSGLTTHPVGYHDLLYYREKLIQLIKENLTNKERQFLMSVKLGDPNYSLIPDLNVESLPALRWKVINVRKMSAEKHQAAIEKLKRALEL